MTKIYLFLLIIMCASCTRMHAPATDLSFYVGKIRSYAYINGDSVKRYKVLLQKIADSSKPVQHAFLLYADALYFVTIGSHAKATGDFRAAATLFRNEKNEQFFAYCLMGIGNCYKLTGDYERAIFNFLQANTLFEKTHDRLFSSVCNINLAETYQLKNDLFNAKKYIALGKVNSDPTSKPYISAMHLEANIYGAAGRPDSALLIDREGIDLSVKHGYADMLSAFYDNIAQCFVAERNYDSAAFYYGKCILLDSAAGRMQLVADTYAQMVNVFGYQREEQKMLSAAGYANLLCDNTQYLKGKYAVFEGLSNYYRSNESWEKLAAVKDSLHNIYRKLINQQTEAKIAEYNIGYETAARDRVINEQKTDLQQATYLALLLSTLALLLLISIFALYRNYRARRKTSVDRAVQLQKDGNTKAVFESEQAERIRIARDLHDSVGQKLSVLKMYLSNKKNNEEKIPVLLDDAITEIRNISHGLLPEELNFGFLKAVKLDIEKLKEATAITIVSEIDDDADYQQISLLASLNVLRIFRELINNIIHHSGANNLVIRISLYGGTLLLHIEDDGKGIDKKQIAESTGLGWKNIFTRVNMLKGEINIENNIPSGNTVTIKIPAA